MSLFEELIGQPLDQISDEELDQIVMTGRLGREQPTETKAKKAGSSAKKKQMELDLSEFD